MPGDPISVKFFFKKSIMKLLFYRLLYSFQFSAKYLIKFTVPEAANFFAKMEQLRAKMWRAHYLMDTCDLLHDQDRRKAITAEKATAHGVFKSFVGLVYMLGHRQVGWALDQLKRAVEVEMGQPRFPPVWADDRSGCSLPILTKTTVYWNGNPWISLCVSEIMVFVQLETDEYLPRDISSQNQKYSFCAN
jgi:hypothetical protein